MGRELDDTQQDDTVMPTYVDYEIKTQFTESIMELGQIAEDEARLAMLENCNMLKRELKSKMAPHRVTGTAEEAITFEVTGSGRDLVGRVFVGDSINPLGGKNAADYSYILEVGQSPHKSPLDPIAQWAQAALGIGRQEAKRIVKKIENSGVDGKFIWVEVFYSKIPEIEANFALHMDNVVERATR